MVFLQGKQQRATPNEKGLREYAILAAVVKKSLKDETQVTETWVRKKDRGWGRTFLVPGTPNAKNQPESCDSKWLLVESKRIPPPPEFPSVTPHPGALSWVLRSP